MKEKWPKIEPHNLHSLCSYLGSFPPELANFFIRNFSKQNALVYDPFSGRGTTLLESRILGRKGIASDLNPIALCLSKAKSTDYSLDVLMSEIDELEKNYDFALFYPEVEFQPDEIKIIFHPETLAELCYIKYKLLRSKSTQSDFILGCLLGILHGSERKDGSSKYLSISMPNTFSMSPGYVKRYVERNQLNRTYRSVFDLLRRAVTIGLSGINKISNDAEVYECDASKISTHSQFKNYIGQVELILTSPPYLGVINYAKQNWIRSWLMSSNPDELVLDDNLGMSDWLNFSLNSSREMKKMLKPNGTMIQVIGDVAKPNRGTIPLARDYAKLILKDKLFKNAWIFNDVIDASQKSTKIWKEKSGQATKIDRIVILSDVNPFEGMDHYDFFNFKDIEANTDKLLF